MDKIPHCSIIVLNYNDKPHLKDCLSSLEETNYPKNKYEVIMVDNGSTDGSVEFVRKNFPQVKILQLNKNYGFAEGNNRGLKIAKGEYVLFLNADTKVDEQWLKELVKIAKDECVGICGSKVMDFFQPDRIQSAGSNLDMIGVPHHRGRGEIDCGKYNKVENVFFVSGSSLLVKKEVLDKLKYCFDPSYFIYYEEVDLCWRVKLLGYMVVFVPSSVVFHKARFAIPKVKNIVNTYRNRILSFRKNLRFPLKQILLFFVLIRTFAAIVYWIYKKKWRHGILVFKYLFTPIHRDVDLSKISLKRQLKLLSFPTISKHFQFFILNKK